ncbi:MAG: HAD family hydrolase [Anaerolineales bacterium]|nr:HAD family hydrolase [Anaerolineales bacterium]
MMKRANGYKAIFFDLDGTLRHSVPLGADVFTEHAIALGMTISEKTRLDTARWEHFYWAQSEILLQDAAQFDGDEKGFWENYTSRRLEKLGATPQQAEAFLPLLRKHMNKKYKPKNWTPPEVYDLLPKLRAAGYSLSVVSNRRTPFADVLEELDLLQHFDLVMAAGEVNSWKPEPEIFVHALERAGVRAEESLYIGDNYYADVVGARNAGLTPVLYDPREIFPDADCKRITLFSELTDIL